MHGKGKSQGEAIATAFEVIREKDFRGGNRFAEYSASEVDCLRREILEDHTVRVDGLRKAIRRVIHDGRFTEDQIEQSLNGIINFTQVRLDRRVYNSIEELASRNVQTVEENVRVILRYITYIYRNYKQVLENNIENRNQKFESHGFFLGFLANFTHLYAIDIDLDLSSRNSHVAFLVRRQAERENVPIVINLATEETLSNTALALAIGHAERLHASSFISIHTGSRNAVCVRLNFNLNRIPFRIDTVRLQQGRFPLVQRLFECVEEETRENIRDFLLQHLPTEIPRNAENYDTIFDCITGFAFGSSAFTRNYLELEEGGDQVRVKKYIFRYDNEDLRKNALTMVFHAQDFPIVILDIRTPHDIRSIKAIALPPGYNGAVNRVTYILNNQYVLNVVLDRFNSPNHYLHRNRYASFDGNLIEVPNAENVHNTLNQFMNDGWQDRGQHQELFRAISRVLMPENMNGNTIIDVNGEYRFRSILHGTFYASDNSYKVLAKYKVGQTYSLKRGREEEGERVIITQVTEQGLDLLLLRQPTESDTDTHPIGYILRFASNAEEIAQEENKAKYQITELMNKQRGYIPITSGNEVVLSYAIFDRNAWVAEDLISIPQELYVHRLDRRGRDLRSGGLVGPESVIDENFPGNLLSDQTRENFRRFYREKEPGQNLIFLLDIGDDLHVPFSYLQCTRAEAIEILRSRIREARNATPPPPPKAQGILERINNILRGHNRGTIQDVDNLITLDFATDNGYYRYWLQQHDIPYVAGAQRYNFPVESEMRFHIMGIANGQVDVLKTHIRRFKNEGGVEPRRSILIVNLGGNHWVTLVIDYRNGNYIGYYADSLGHDAQDVIKRVLGESNIILHNVSVQQQTDGYNCGFWALENARDINEVLQQNNNLGNQGRGVLDEMRNSLTVNVPGLNNPVDPSNPRDENYFQVLRVEVSRELQNLSTNAGRARYVTTDANGHANVNESMIFTINNQNNSEISRLLFRVLKINISSCTVITLR
ncbi:cytoplasmic incompatibility factor CifB [Wolbachia endosymbiont (group E) of Neria commutata]|uniref:cytoplasmic incompatibility factor CifB n=1 Tax=Wolbachia endosymbiont (group E) of Neria commutata TaxID=3066149 RepID=UPI0031334E0A